MTGDRYVLLGLARPRAPWFGAVAQWATAAGIPAEFVKCLSVEEVRARLSSGRPHSGVLVDATHPAFDRDLVELCVRTGVPVIAVGRQIRPRGPDGDFGAAAVLPPDFDRAMLLDALSSHCRRIGRVDAATSIGPEPTSRPWRGRLLAVCGPGGTGASTVAIALAQAFATDPRSGGRVVLADFARRAEQAMLHDSGEVTPGVQELVEAHRLMTPTEAEVEHLTYLVAARNYRLLLGLRQARFWTTIGPRAFDAAVENLRATFQVVVADIDSDFEGDGDGGSVDVQERNHMARATASAADAVVVVARPGMKGLASLGRVVSDLLDHGVAGPRILPVINAVPKHSAKGEIVKFVDRLCDHRTGRLSPAVLLSERRVDQDLRDGMALPSALTAPLIEAVNGLLERQLDVAPPMAEPVLVAPGSLGRWSDEDELTVGGADPE